MILSKVQLVNKNTHLGGKPLSREKGVSHREEFRGILLVCKFLQFDE
jgi:hypothetical protein